MQITITLPQELTELLDNDPNLTLAEIDLLEKTVTIYDARTQRYDYSTHYGINAVLDIQLISKY